jgi:ABC-2 type transport system permease protein
VTVRHVQNIYRLGLKEFVSLRHDRVLLISMAYAFTIAVYVPATGTGLELRNASVAIVDEDESRLSARIADAFLPPFFLPPERIAIADIDRVMDAGRYTFVIDIPPDFQADVLAGRQPALQVNVDATAMSQAGIGAGYIRNMLTQELTEFLRGRYESPLPPVDIVIRPLFNPNLDASWFVGVMQIVNMITVLAIVLTGAALIREREHGTLDHLLVMPLTSLDIMLSKAWANGLVIIAGAMLSLFLVVMGLLRVPIAGSILLFVFGIVLYLFSVTSIGIFLATVVRSMPQLGLLFIPIVFPMMLLSGGYTPLDGMPQAIRTVTMFSPTTHFVSIAQAILFRGAGFGLIWQSFAAVAAIGAVFFLGALVRFRASVAVTRT